MALAKTVTSVWPNFPIWERKMVSPRPPASFYSIPQMVCFIQNTLKCKYNALLVSESGSRKRIVCLIQNCLLSHTAHYYNERVLSLVLKAFYHIFEVFEPTKIWKLWWWLYEKWLSSPKRFWLLIPVVETTEAQYFSGNDSAFGFDADQKS